MSKQRSRGTAAELAVRRELHRRGLRYRVHVRPLAALRREADILFSAVKLAVMVDGELLDAGHGHASVCPAHR